MPPKVARRVLRRPAAAAPRVRRPAARGADEESEEAAVPPRLLSGLTFAELKKLGPVCLQDASILWQDGSSGRPPRRSED